MLFRTKNTNRPYHLGEFPFEILAKNPSIIDQEANTPPLIHEKTEKAKSALAGIARKYAHLFMEDRNPETAPSLSDVPEDLAIRTMDIKGFCQFLDADHVGITKVPASAWYEDAENPKQQYAIVVVVEDGRMPEAGELASQWLDGASKDISHMRSVERVIVKSGV